MKDAGLICRVLVDEKSAIDEVRDLPGWARLKALRDKEPEGVEKPEKQKKKDDKVGESPADQLRLAMWYISRFESPEKALAVVTAAVAAVKACTSESPPYGG